MKVLNLINSIDVGGAESLLVNFVSELRKDKYLDLEICTLYRSTFLNEKIEKTDVPYWELNLKFKYDLMGVLKLVKLIRKRKYDIVHVHLFPSAMFSAIASFFVPKNVKFVFTEHSVYNRRRSSKIFKLLDIFIYNRYSKIICVSNQVRLNLIKWLPKLEEKIDIIFNGTPFIESEEDQFLKQYDILFVGRLERIKGVETLIEAINIINLRYDKVVRVAIVGDGSFRKQLEEIVKRLKLNDYVKFLGTRKDINELMKSSRIFVLPSNWEGLPMAILEAMSMRLPIVATDVGGIPEIIKDGENGLLVPPRDSRILAKTIFQLLIDKNLQTRLTQSAYKKVRKEYSIQNYIKNTLNLYESLIKQQDGSV